MNFTRPIADGIEGFGFATRFKDEKNDERLLNELPLLTHFIKTCKQKYSNLFHLLEEAKTDISSYLGPAFFENPKGIKLPLNRALFLKEIGCNIPSLTSRENDLLKFLAHGFPASYIALELRLSERTIENYLATLKTKLGCSGKVELIRKAQEIASMGYFGQFDLS